MGKIHDRLRVPPAGRVRLYRVPDVIRLGRSVGKSTMAARPLSLAGWQRRTGWRPNLVLKEWATIVGNGLIQGGANYRISTMYVEFRNVADPDVPVPAPAFDRGPDSGVAYYNGLAGSADTDYLRVPLVAGILNASDPVEFPGGNRPTFFAQTTGVQGVHGRPFSDADQSVIYGAALVATPAATDATRDLVLSRVYFDAADQQAKLPTSQIGIEWDLTLE